MFFQNVKDKAQIQAIFGLGKDAVFLDRFKTDPILDKLYDERIDITECFIELCSTVSIPIIIEDTKYNPVKLFPFVYLWCIDSPLAKSNSKEVSEIDLDIFFYTLDNQINEDALTITTKAVGEVKRRGLTFDKALLVAQALLNQAFQPLKMFPHTSNEVVGNTQCRFDADWMTSMVSKVHSVTGYEPSYIMHNLSLAACCFYYIQWCRINGIKNIEKRTPEEILKAISDRTDELVADRLIELNVLKTEDRSSFLKLVRTPPE